MQESNLKTWRAANIYVKAGLSVIPIRTDGTKALALKSGERKTYESRLANDAELRSWFHCNRPHGIAILGGKVSGNLECIDFDLNAESNFQKWKELIPADLFTKLTINRTPRPGYHIIYRVDNFAIPGSMKLATVPKIDIGTARLVRETSIETRGEGGYFIAPGSPKNCHEKNLEWTPMSEVRLSRICSITIEQRAILINAARSFDIADLPKHKPVSGYVGLTPWDDYNQRGPSWNNLLEPAGWTIAFQHGEVTYWKRPSKEDSGWSATTGKCKTPEGYELFHVFSSNAHPFEPKNYTKSMFHAIMLHKGDFSASARALRDEGYGEQRKQRPEQTTRTPPAPNYLRELTDAVRKRAMRLDHSNKETTLEVFQDIGAIAMLGIDYIKDGVECDLEGIAE